MHKIVKVYTVIEDTNAIYMKYVGSRPSLVGFSLDPDEAQKCAQGIPQSGYCRHVETRYGIQIEETGEVFLLVKPEPVLIMPAGHKCS